MPPTALRATGPSVVHLALRSKRFAVSVLETNDGPTLKAQRVECELIRHSKRSVLSVNGKKLRRPCLDRFAVFAKASRIFAENAQNKPRRGKPGVTA